MARTKQTARKSSKKIAGNPSRGQGHQLEHRKPVMAEAVGGGDCDARPIVEEARVTTEPVVTHSGERETDQFSSTTTISAEDIQSLKTILCEEEHFRCQITIISKFKEYCDLIRERLSSDDLEKFKQTQFGHLFNMSEYHQQSIQLMWFFLLRQLETKKKNELWMMVNGTPMRFSMTEFAMITGLNFSNCVDEKRVNEAKINTRLRDKYFKGKPMLSVDVLKEQLLKFPLPVNGMTDQEGTHDRLKIALVLFLVGVLKTKESGKIFNASLLGLVDDIELFDMCSWGVETYLGTVNSIQKMNLIGRACEYKKKGEIGNKKKKITFYGFVHALQIWGYELVPAIAEKFAKKRNDSFPRMLRWETKLRKDAPSYTEIAWSFEGVEVGSLLVPTEEERKLGYMSNIIALNDEEDPVIDRLVVKLQAGGRIPKDQVKFADARPSVKCESSSGMLNRDTQNSQHSMHDLHSAPSFCAEVPPLENDFKSLRKYIDERLSKTEANIHSFTTSKIDRQIGQKMRRVEEKLDLLHSTVMKQPPHHLNDQTADYNDGCSLHTETMNTSDGPDPQDCHLIPDTEVEKESDALKEGVQNMENEEKRLGKRSAILQHPYTGLCKRRMYKRPDRISDDPLREGSEIKENCLKNFLSKEGKDEITYYGLDARPKSLFKDILDRRRWFSEDSFSFEEVGKKFLISTQIEIKERWDGMCEIGLEIGNLEEQLGMLIEHKKEVEQTMKELQDSGAPCLMALPDRFSTKEEVVAVIQKRGHPVTAFLCNISRVDPSQESRSGVPRDVIGIVALLGRVNSIELSRVLSEYLGTDQMLAVVTRSFESASALERYQQNGEVGKSETGRFLMICLDDISPFEGDFVRDDPQRKLSLRAPCLFDGAKPPGFLGFAVNLIDFDEDQLSVRTDASDGLRETLFYRLFGKLQVYRTRAEMLAARGCVKHGAVSLDGAILKENGMISFGLGDAEICFQVVATTENETPDSQELMKRLDEIRSELKKTNEALAEATEDHAEKKKRFEAMKDEYDKLVEIVAPILGTQGTNAI